MRHFRTYTSQLSDDLRVATLAKRCGFGSATSLQRLFVRRLGVSPTPYRDKFRAQAAMPAAAASERRFLPAK